jgi:hypothetical protein
VADPDPDPYKYITDPDPEDPKKYGSYAPQRRCGGGEGRRGGGHR